jgi:hypothetical protein
LEQKGQRSLQKCWRGAQRWLISISATIGLELAGQEVLHEVGHFGGRANPILLQDICRWKQILLLSSFKA